MANTFTKIASYTVPTTGTISSYTFSSIPQTYTNLQVMISSKSSRTSNTWDNLGVQFNGVSGAIYSSRLFYNQGGTGAGNYSSATTYFQFTAYSTATGSGSATTNTFSNDFLFIPNYTGSNYKSIIADSSTSMISGTDFVNSMGGGVWESTAAINSITLFAGSGTFNQYTEFTLYGI
jgi:hypothetical protein